jgi:hypothetical protein
VECVFDESGDGRRKEAIKRKQEDGDLFHHLITALRSSTDMEAVRLLNLIRSDTPLPELKALLRDHFDASRQQNDGPSPDLERVSRELDSLEREQADKHQKVLDIRRLTDAPLYRVSAAPWTNVTADNDLVSHLVTVYVAWHLPLCSYMDRDFFIQSMQSGDLDSSFCSPFLVNAVLAMACVSLH